MNEIYQWILVGIAVAFVAIDRAIKFYNAFAWKRNGRNRRKSLNDSGNPGYGERIAKLETAMEGVEEDVKAIKDKLNLV
jgi:hypothetical protein